MNDPVVSVGETAQFPRFSLQKLISQLPFSCLTVIPSHYGVSVFNSGEPLSSSSLYPSYQHWQRHPTATETTLATRSLVPNVDKDSLPHQRSHHLPEIQVTQTRRPKRIHKLRNKAPTKQDQLVRNQHLDL